MWFYVVISLFSNPNNNPKFDLFRCSKQWFNSHGEVHNHIIHSWSSFIYTKKWPCFPAVMNLVTFAPCLEVRLDPTLRKKSHGEFAQIGSDCLTRNSPTKKLLTCCSFCTYLEKTPRAIFLNAPSTCQSPKLANGDSNPTHLIAMIVGTGQRIGTKLCKWWIPWQNVTKS